MAEHISRTRTCSDSKIEYTVDQIKHHGGFTWSEGLGKVQYSKGALKREAEMVCFEHPLAPQVATLSAVYSHHIPVLEPY